MQFIFYSEFFSSSLDINAYLIMLINNLYILMCITQMRLIGFLSEFSITDFCARLQFVCSTLSLLLSSSSSSSLTICIQYDSLFFLNYVLWSTRRSLMSSLRDIKKSSNSKFVLLYSIPNRNKLDSFFFICVRCMFFSSNFFLKIGLLIR